MFSTIARWLKCPWIGTLLLALPGFLLLAAATRFASFNPRHAMNLFFVVGNGLPFYLMIGVGLLLLANAVRLLLQRRNPKQLHRPSAGPFLLSLLLSCGFLSFCAYVAWDRQLFDTLRGDVTDESRLAALRAAKLEETGHAAVTTDWPQWRGPRRDGTSGETGLNVDWTKSAPPVAWRAPIKGGYSSIAAVGDKLYTMDRDGMAERVLCFHATDGKLLWSYDYPVDYTKIDRAYQDGPRATPTVSDNRIYTVGATGLMVCLDATVVDGKAKLLWQHDLMQEFNAQPPRWGVACSPLVDGDLVIAQPGGGKGSIAAFNRVSGDLVWTCRTEPSGYSSPVMATLGGVRQIVAATSNALVGVRPSDGMELWSFRWVTDFEANIATPIVAGDYVFYSSGYNRGCVLLEIQGGPEHQSAGAVYVKNNKLMRNHHCTCILKDGFLYGCDTGSDVLKCIDLRTAEEKWASREIKKKCVSILADGHLFTLTEEGVLACVEASPEAFKIKGKLELFGDGAERVWALPALKDGMLYARSGTELVCVKLN